MCAARLRMPTQITNTYRPPRCRHVDARPHNFEKFAMEFMLECGVLLCKGAVRIMYAVITYTHVTHKVIDVLLCKA